MVLQLSPLSRVPLFATPWSPHCPPSQCEEGGDGQETVTRCALAAQHPSRGESGVCSAPRFQDVAAPLSPGLASRSDRGSAVPPPLTRAARVPRRCRCQLPEPSSARSSPGPRLPPLPLHCGRASIIEGNRRRLNRTNEEPVFSPGSEAPSSRTGGFQSALVVLCCLFLSTVVYFLVLTVIYHGTLTVLFIKTECTAAAGQAPCWGRFLWVSLWVWPRCQRESAPTSLGA